jgi:hypothetical protein
MTTRRNVLLLSGGALAAAALTGCRERATTTTKPAPVPDVLLADSEQGLVRLSGSDAQRLGPASALSWDGTVLYTVTGTSLVRLDPAGGAPIRSSAIGGGWVPRVVSTDGRACALAPTPAADHPAARARSPLLVVTEDGERRYDLAGVVEPDAFTRDGTGLFVLEWLPAQAPDHYRVRLLDLATGRMQPLLTRNKVPVPRGAEEEMRGEGRQAVLSADGQFLYTLYTHQPGHQHTRNLLAGTRSGVHAFVHVLHLTERWAYCLDLPDPFGSGPPAGHALAADGQHIAVLDTASGSLAYAGAASLAIERVAKVPAGGGAASLILAPDRRVFVGAGATVAVLDRGSDRVTGSWTLPATVRGLGLSGDRTRLYAGGADEVLWLDAAAGAVRGRMAVAGLTRLRHVA